jgi:hypothetical protein
MYRRIATCQAYETSETQARGAPPAPLARKRRQQLLATLWVLALEKSEASPEHPAVTVARELVLHEGRQRRDDVVVSSGFERGDDGLASGAKVRLPRATASSRGSGIACSGCLPAPTRRRFAASVFPKFGRCPNGEDGVVAGLRPLCSLGEPEPVAPRPVALCGPRSSAHALRHAAWRVETRGLE